MFKKLNRGVLGIAFLILAFCGCVWIGKETEISIVSFIILSTVLVSTFLIIVIYANPITKSVQLAEDIEDTIDDNKLDSEETMLKDIETMNSFGSRTTGSDGHKQFVLWLEQQLADMGFEVHRDTYTFDRWEEKRSAVFIDNEEVPVSAAYPYSGETDELGVTGELVYTKSGNYVDVKGKIIVVEIDNTKMLPMGFIMNERQVFPQQNHVVLGDGDLVLTSTLQNPNLKKAKEMGAKAVILVWKGVSDEKVKDQYLPFTTKYAGIPAVWVNQTEGQKVIEAAQNHKQSTVILEAEKEENAVTESFYVTMEGKNKQESILINTHTDGVNVVEEDGAIGMLSMIRYLSQTQPERTMVFAFVTGHFRLPDFKGTSQATSMWMQDHPELWDGKEGHMKAVAGITVEHLGSMEWKDNASGQYEATGDIQTEYTYTGNATMEAIWRKAIEERETVRTVTLRGHNRFEFGESQPLLEAGIPLIGLVASPDYLMADSENREMDKFNITLMREQIESLLKATIMVDDTPTNQLGKAEGYSYLIGRTN
ncbi:PA domain-containing protein [Lachnotalea glycerini]|uniref:PA domain-containing protein n=1 Tax=Lachnotalea glycerini TaxID=1763509 RepID=A0A318ELC5_9FIRM|nr:hypothetical protein [Lachnotalea glycerini]PXV89536.1 PA domain-containing protein [Lachnotalea glycerini]